MTDTQARIEQFRRMSEADPNNELGHFSLGRALLDAGEYAEAAKCFQRVIALNPNIGKVYQLLAQAQLALGQRDLAIESLKTGARTAHNRGDLLPKNEMLKMLRELGVEMPELDAAATPQQVGEGQVHCKRCGQVKSKLPAPPFRNAFGQQIQQNTCADCWREAIAFGTKVINELRLPMADPQAQQIWNHHIREFLNLNR
ncbi:Fe(2+)-trafficking protein [Fontivita pretiosa]|jgi:tetratricopeptide (TPR) repeat protein|uniref:Fe(2+)-trafficking protein n=1 Tax=Fontivita pretiosa TaxID=2989684 RepID=UPI003D16FD8E